MGRAAASLAIAACIASSASAATRVPVASLSSLELAVVADINAFRAQHGLSPLQVNESLTIAARAHSQQMASDGYFAHDSADGVTYAQRLEAFYRAPAGHVSFVGENLLWASPRIGAHRALLLWLASPEHRRNLLDPRWREIGIAVVHARAAPGVYGGRPVTIMTTDFGAQR